jgi:hypothetical protein
MHGEKKNGYKVLIEISEEKYLFGDLGVDGKISIC